MRFIMVASLFLLASCASTPPPAVAVFQPVPGLSDSAQRPVSPKERKYFSYYKKLRSKLEAEWRSEMAAKLKGDRHAYDSDMAGEKNDTAGISIAISPDGTLKKLTLLDPAHHRALYETVASTVAKAAPFEPPPSDLVDPKTGLVEVRWDFILQR